MQNSLLSLTTKYPNLILEKSPDHPNRIRVLRLNETEKELRRELLKRQAWEGTVMKIGMWRVFDALRRVCGGRGNLDRTSPLFAPNANKVDLNATQGMFVNDDDEEDVDEYDGRNEGGSQDRTTPKPLVVHNGFMDLLFLLTHFNRKELPDTLPECKRLISSYFPVVYDTKVMATECSALWNNDRTVLSYLYENVVRDDPAMLHSIDVVQVRGGLNDDDEEEEDGEVEEEPEVPDGQEHEAAYDAFMTGSVFAGLSTHIKYLHRRFDGFQGLPHLVNATGNGTRSAFGQNELSHESIRAAFGRNKLFQMSMFTLDLEEPENDPLQRGMSPDSAFRVTGIDPSVSTRDIVQCMNDLVDDEGRRVNFDIVWVDDTTFIVACRYRPSENMVVARGDFSLDVDAAILSKHGQLIRQALRNHFRKEEINSLEEYFKLQRQVQTGEEVDRPKGWINKVLGLVGLDRKRPADSNAGDGNMRARKRTRQS